MAATRSKDDPMGSLARTVLSGEAALRTAAANPWHSDGLATSLANAQAERDRMTPDQRLAYERDAERLRRHATEQGDGQAEEAGR
jgi:hypothetical protein